MVPPPALANVFVLPPLSIAPLSVSVLALAVTVVVVVPEVGKATGRSLKVRLCVPVNAKELGPGHRVGVGVIPVTVHIDGAAAAIVKVVVALPRAVVLLMFSGAPASKQLCNAAVKRIGGRKESRRARSPLQACAHGGARNNAGHGRRGTGGGAGSFS